VSFYDLMLTHLLLSPVGFQLCSYCKLGLMLVGWGRGKGSVDSGSV
jgi:hypothetical protein